MTSKKCRVSLKLNDSPPENNDTSDADSNNTVDPQDLPISPDLFDDDPIVTDDTVRTKNEPKNSFNFDSKKPFTSTSVQETEEHKYTGLKIHEKMSSVKNVESSEKSRKRKSDVAAESSCNSSGTGEGSTKDKPLCKYGKECYRKNPLHFKEFRHEDIEKNESLPNSAKKSKISKDASVPTHDDSADFDQTINPYRLLLTKVKGIPQEFNQFLVMGIKDILSPKMGSLVASAQFNYCIDPEWLMDQYPRQFRNKPLLMVCGEEKQKGRGISEDLVPFPNITLCQAKLDIAYGTHHTKMMLLLYEEGLRIVIHTSNLIHNDWHQKTQGMWVSPVCPPLSPSATTNGESVTGFKSDLTAYLTAYRKSQLSEWIQHINKHDLSSIKIHLLGSVPGRHAGREKNTWGHLRLRTILKEHGPRHESTKSWPVIGQFSSIGSLGATPDNWLRSEFLPSLSTTRDCTSFGTKPTLQLIFPSKENIRLSLEGYPAGASVPYSINVAKRQPYLQTYLHQWKSNGRGRTQSSPHIKSYLRYCPQTGKSPWVLLTSANLSKAAWGALEKNQSQLMIRSYELGVLFLPKYFVDTEHFQLSSKLETLKSSSQVFPLPYDLPPKAYSPDDKPWIWDIEYKDLPDTHGNMWCPS